MMIFAMFRVLNSGRSEKIEFEEQDLKESLFPVADLKEIENPDWESLGQNNGQRGKQEQNKRPK